MQLIIGNKRYSSWSFRPWLLMKHAGIPFREIQIMIGQKDSGKKISRYSPGGRVPVLLDGKVTVWESLAICETVTEQFPSKNLWPRDKGARAVARSISHEMHAGFQALRKNLPCHFILRHKNFRIPAEAKPDIARVQEIWTSCRRQYGKGGPFLFGEFSVADAMYAPVVFRFLAYGVPVNKVSRKYMKVMETLPATREWILAALEESERIAAYEKPGK